MENKKLIISIFLVVLISLGIIGSWFYLCYAVNLKKDNVDKINSQIKAIEKQMEESHSLEIFMKDIEGDKERIESIFLEKDALINFIRDLEVLARNSGVVMKLTAIGVDDVDTLGGAHLRLSVRGNFSEIYRYLTLLENVEHQVLIKVAYIREDDGGWLGNFEIILKSFVEKP